MNEKTTLIEFPCDFTLKIIGVSSVSFVSDISQIILKHFPGTPASAISEKRSQHNNYSAINALIKATDQASLDALYQELTAFPGVKMVL